MCYCIFSCFLDTESLFNFLNLSYGKIKYAGMDVLLELCYSGNTPGNSIIKHFACEGVFLGQFQAVTLVKNGDCLDRPFEMVITDRVMVILIFWKLLPVDKKQRK